MNKISKEQFYLELDRATWHCSFQSSNGETYMGTFVFKALLTPMDTIAIDRDYRELLGPVSPNLASRDTYNVAFAAANLKHKIAKSPSFWTDGVENSFPGTQIKGGEDLIGHVMEASYLAETLYKDGLKKRHEEALKKIQAGLEKIQKDAELEEELAEVPEEKKE